MTLVFSEAVRGFLSGVDVTARNGSLSVMTSTDNIVLTGVFTPWVDIEYANNTLTLSGDYSDVAGNVGVSARSNRYAIDTKRPVVSSFTIDDGSLKAGESANVTLVFSEAVRGFLSGVDVTARNGSLSVMTSTDNITWTGGVFTPWVDIEYANNTLTLSGDYSDVAGNVGVSASNRYAIDTKRPVVSSFTIDDGSLKAGESANVTLVFSEAVRGGLSGVDVTARNGSLSVMTSTDNITWIGAFTPWVDIEYANNTLTLSGDYSDVAGNVGVSARSNRYAIDTKRPVVSSFTIDDGSLKAGESANVTLVFSEAVRGFLSGSRRDSSERELERDDLDRQHHLDRRVYTVGRHRIR